MRERRAIAAAGNGPRRLFYYNGGFLRDKRLRAILISAGYELRLGRPGEGDGVAVWGQSPYAARGEAIAARYGAPITRIEDAFLRSVRPGRLGDAPLGLLIDSLGVHFDPSKPSLIEHLLATDPLDDTALLNRARSGIERLRVLELSKYNMFDPDLPPPDPGYVLVVDQIRGDASVIASGATESTFREMLAFAQIEHPGARILLKTHPETGAGLRQGYYGTEHCDHRTELFSDPISPWQLLEGATAVYTVSSQLGFEAILAGHKPRVFGQPFYAGWGLTQDEHGFPRRTRNLTRAQLFAVSHIRAPIWFDPCRNRLCSFEEAVDQLEAETRAFREDRRGHVALGMRAWKRRSLQQIFGRKKPLRFAKSPDRAASMTRESGRDLLIWGIQDAPAMPEGVITRRVEDGFLRSRGLGADLIPPLSLVTDRSGIYYDPRNPSDLEVLIAAPVPPGGRERTERLIRAIVDLGLSKYNIGEGSPDLPDGHRILVPGQVEDDASIRFGAGEICTNLALLAECRRQNPDSVIIFKPHPDVEAGLRPGALAEAEASAYADVIAPNANPATLIEAVDEVWTMTSLLGFEALLRGKPVTCTGAPFYAGWGLTRDLGPVPHQRRSARPDLIQLAHAVLIGYPRYHDPESCRPCPPEVVLERLAHGPIPAPGPANRLLAKLQGWFSGHAHLWR